jgi:hypothetical protein
VGSPSSRIVRKIAAFGGSRADAARPHSSSTADTAGLCG